MILAKPAANRRTPLPAGLVRLAWALSFAFAAVTSGASRVAAQADAPTPPALEQQDRAPQPTRETIFNDWRVICPASKASPLAVCVMAPVETTTRPDRSRLQLVVELPRDRPGDGTPVMVFGAPLDTLLPDGVTFRIDDRHGVKLPFRSCHANGCLAPFRPTGALLAGFRRGLDLKAESLSLHGSKRSLAISLRGFTAALGHLRTAAVDGAPP